MIFPQIECVCVCVVYVEAIPQMPGTHQVAPVLALEAWVIMVGLLVVRVGLRSSACMSSIVSTETSL